MEEQRAFIPPKRINTDFPVIDTDPHIKRCFSYARREDWLSSIGMGAVAPAFMLATERWAPSYAGKAAFNSALRLSFVFGAIATGFFVWEKSTLRFWGWTENAREVEMDMREMTDRVKRGEPLYGHSQLTPYMQGVAARNSRYSMLLGNIIPWANFVNHNQHGVDTAKYYQNAERELEAEKAAANQ